MGEAGGGGSRPHKFLLFEVYSFAIVIAGALIALFVFLGHVMWEEADRLQAASRGTAGVSGIVTVTRTPRPVPGGGSCYGVLHPDGGGPAVHDVWVPDQFCALGDRSRGNVIGTSWAPEGALILPGDYRGRRIPVVVIWMLVPATLVGLVFVLRFIREVVEMDAGTDRR